MGIAALGGDVHLRLLHFAHYGKLFIKATRLHPDFFMQVRATLALTLTLALALALTLTLTLTLTLP